MKSKKSDVVQFDFTKVVELTEDQLRTKVNGGASLTPAEQYEIAQRAARGDLSGVESVKSSEKNNILAYGSSETKPASIDEREKADVEVPAAVETTKSKTSVSESLKTEPEKETVKSNSIDEREKRDSGSSSISSSSSSSSSSSNSNTSSNSSSSTSSNSSSYSYKKIAELKKESDQKYEMEVDYTKNGNDELAVTVRTQNEDGTYDYSHGKVMSKIYHNVTNNVKSPQQRGAPVLFNGYYYYPQQFPDGSWNITEVEYKDDKNLYGTFAIRTDANVEVLQYNNTGTEIVGTVIDSGYLIHAGVSPTTWGCLKMPDEENLWNFAGLSNYILENNGIASINIMDYNLFYK